ncbi:MAG: BlaI/MecI/CopY family transcriptional regulator [Bacteroidetes bacterium]|nr:BlaI/MecI/CopY family transcriptional regulator [Bacteroidota bacterium]MBL6944917.1 BlaI/MecI/CopY family transcriptional regulator [Bacteroidales bacterium]
MKQLTKAEEQIMHVLWELKKGYVREILDKLHAPKPAYNTVSTIIRILEKKGFVGYIAYGKAHEYYPVISKNIYRKNFFKGFIQNYFGNSYQALTSFFTNEKDLSLNELEDLRQLLDKEIEKKLNEK